MRILGRLATFLVFGFLCVGCKKNLRDEPFESISETGLATNAFRLRDYVREFSQPAVEKDLSFAREILATNGLVITNIDGVDYNSNCSLWLIRTHLGTGFFEKVRFFLFSEKSNLLSEWDVFAGKDVESASILTHQSSGGALILAELKPSHDEWWVRELWTNDLQRGTSSRLAVGGRHEAAPDHCKVAFWRTDGSGYHSLLIWDVWKNEIKEVISLWEADPGSGTSWTCRWSTDSRAFNIHGDCSGFQRQERRKRREIDLIYLMEEGRVFQMAK